MIRLRIVVLGLLLMSLSVYAQERTHPAWEEGTSFGKSHAVAVGEGVKAFQANQVPGFSTPNPKETEYDASNLSAAAVSEASQSEIGVTLRQGYQNRPTDFVNQQEGWLKKGLAVEGSNNPAQILASHYSDCKPIQTEEKQGYQTLTCDEFVDGEEKTCTIGWVVEVDAKHTYECKSTRQKEKLNCSKELIIEVSPSPRVQKTIQVNLAANNYDTNVFTVDMKTGKLVSATGDRIGEIDVQVSEPLDLATCPSLSITQGEVAVVDVGNVPGGFSTKKVYLSVVQIPSCSNNLIAQFQIYKKHHGFWAKRSGTFQFIVQYQPPKVVTKEYWDNGCVALEARTK